VLITRLYLRNFRVYEDELDLEIPPGLVGIYGPNGAGKSTLLEAILWTLWGKARTTKDQIRSSGVGHDGITEVEFEHEGHLYLVRRSLKGINSQVTVEAHCDGHLMSTGTRDAERFIESVLGMDDAAFRASVFTEQKQLAAFSNQTPAERRKLVLQLLGITPLDDARDAARKDARQLTSDHARVRGLLVNLDALVIEAADAAARAEAVAVAATDEATAAGAARQKADAATVAWQAIDLRRQEYDALVIEGRSVRKELDATSELVDSRLAELAELDRLAGQLAGLDAAAAGGEELEQRLDALSTLASAARAWESIVVPDPPAPIDEVAIQETMAAAEKRRTEVATVTALLTAARTDQERTQAAADRSRSLDASGDCPTCGQALGDSFERVQAHRAAEAEAAAAHVAELSSRLKRAQAESKKTDAAARQAQAEEAAARSRRAEWEQADARRRHVTEDLDQAWQPVRTEFPEVPSSAVVAARIDRYRTDLRWKREAAGQAAGIRARLEARPTLESALATARERLQETTGRVEVLREKLKALDFRPDALESARAARDEALGAAEVAAARAQQAALDAAGERQRAVSAAERLADGRAQHAQLADLEAEARHRSRAADLLSEFRNTVVASVGPRLAERAADLFAELTDHEYETVEVDGETYQLQIGDAGHLYGLDRFSGSEIDLANLALRVAISEHIHFQSGGSVGLLVLDEVFGPLDEDRKARMLMALERLRGRFRQVLVVTHDSEIKEQMPNAIEVVKKPGRRATAHVVG
jgi:exonuclease SbcC